MRLLYDLGIRLYYLGILAASLFNRKAGQWIRGRKGWRQELERGTDAGSEYIWFHCSSLGEFEQGRSVLEAIRKEFPSKKILLTFFSPSGYEVRKNYPGADHIAYLPLDTHKNARHFLDTVNITLAYFVKYEFWFHFITELNSRKIPTYLISAIFRKEQVFFRSYGGWYRKMLHGFDCLFLQDPASGELLKQHRITHFRVSGDTRFDRVHEIARNATEISLVKEFAGSQPVLVAGSTWPRDEELLCSFINETDSEWKYILVPHEINPAHIQKLKEQISKQTLIYSEMQAEALPDASVLIIDAIGLLSSLYRYGQIAYIGGGFGKGIHNTLEAATFGLPVVFGPRFDRFREAKELIQSGAGHPVHDLASLRSTLKRFFDKPELLKTSGKAAADYVNTKIGATSDIVNSTFKS